MKRNRQSITTLNTVMCGIVCDYDDAARTRGKIFKKARERSEWTIRVRAVRARGRDDATHCWSWL